MRAKSLELSRIEAVFLSMQVVGLALIFQGLILYSPVNLDLAKGELKIRECRVVHASRSSSYKQIIERSINVFDSISTSSWHSSSMKNTGEFC